MNTTVTAVRRHCAADCTTERTADTDRAAVTHLRRARGHVAAYLGLSVVTLGVAYLERHHTGAVNGAVWIRGGIVAATAALMLSFAARAIRGSRGAWRRLRLSATALLGAAVTVAAIPGLLPVWMRIEQGLCAVVLVAVLHHVNRTSVRTFFSTGSNPARTTDM